MKSLEVVLRLMNELREWWEGDDDTRSDLAVPRTDKCKGAVSGDTHGPVSVGEGGEEEGVGLEPVQLLGQRQAKSTSNFLPCGLLNCSNICVMQ